MTVINKTKSNISPINKSKGVGAEWSDLVSTWSDSLFGWSDVFTFNNKSKSSITPINKSKTNM